MTTLQRLLAGNCYFSITNSNNCPTTQSFRLSLDPSGSPPMEREIKEFASYNVFVKNQATGKYERIGILQIIQNSPNFVWWKPLEWLQAKVMLKQAIAGVLPVTFINRCCRCGKIISVENSKKGYGPECKKYLEIGGDNNC